LDNEKEVLIEVYYDKCYSNEDCVGVSWKLILNCVYDVLCAIDVGKRYL
jgi:hypothetical protein